MGLIGMFGRAGGVGVDDEVWLRPDTRRPVLESVKAAKLGGCRVRGSGGERKLDARTQRQAEMLQSRSSRETVHKMLSFAVARRGTHKLSHVSFTGKSDDDDDDDDA
jgi:hypothetical protein